jgi:hypothetical protein
VRRELLAVPLLLVVACSTAARNFPAAAAPGERTIHVTRSQFGSEITVRVGDVLKVARPADYDEWDLSFSDDVLRSLNTEEGRRHPPADGWTFAVVARGTTDIALAPFVSRGGTPNVPKFVVTVTAE